MPGPRRVLIVALIVVCISLFAQTPQPEPFFVRGENRSGEARVSASDFRLARLDEIPRASEFKREKLDEWRRRKSSYERDLISTVGYLTDDPRITTEREEA